MRLIQWLSWLCPLALVHVAVQATRLAGGRGEAVDVVFSESECAHVAAQNILRIPTPTESSNVQGECAAVSVHLHGHATVGLAVASAADVRAVDHSDIVAPGAHTVI